MNNWQDGEPMMRPDELSAFLSYVNAVPPNSTILEYGCGGSTLAMQKILGSRRLFSVEHNIQWVNRVRPLITSPNITLVCEPNQLNRQEWLASGSEVEELSSGGSRYICAPIVHNKDWDWNNVGLILVDGVARGACLAWLRKFVSPTTVVLIHDYTGREYWYAWAAMLYRQVALTQTLLELRAD